MGVYLSAPKTEKESQNGGKIDDSKISFSTVFQFKAPCVDDSHGLLQPTVELPDEAVQKAGLTEASLLNSSAPCPSIASCLSPVLKSSDGSKQKLNELFTSSRYGIAAMQGWRQSMEDAHVASPNVTPYNIGIYGVFDGHGGNSVSAWVAKHFITILKNEIEEILKKLRAGVDDDYKAKQNLFTYYIDPVDEFIICESLKNTFLKIDVEIQSEENRNELKILYDTAEGHKKDGSFSGRGNRSLIQKLIDEDASNRRQFSKQASCTNKPDSLLEGNENNAMTNIEADEFSFGESTSNIQLSINSFEDDDSFIGCLEKKDRNDNLDHSYECISEGSTAVCEERTDMLQNESNTDIVTDLNIELPKVSQDIIVELQDDKQEDNFVSDKNIMTSCNKNETWVIRNQSESIDSTEVKDEEIFSSIMASRTEADHSIEFKKREDDPSSSPINKIKKKKIDGENDYKKTEQKLDNDHGNDIEEVIFHKSNNSTDNDNEQANKFYVFDDDDEDEIVNDDLDEPPNPDPSSPESCGATAVVGVIIFRFPNTLFVVANAGDSRAVISRCGIAVPMSLDHKPDTITERTRIYNAGGVVLNGRVDGNLNLSRCVGDLYYKQNRNLKPEQQKITALPDIRIAKITDGDEFAILACDGIWDCVSNQEAVNFVRERLHDESRRTDPNILSKICEELCDVCLSSGPLESDGIGCDNMTCIIVEFSKAVRKGVVDQRIYIYPSDQGEKTSINIYDTIEDFEDDEEETIVTEDDEMVNTEQAESNNFLELDEVVTSDNSIEGKQLRGLKNFKGKVTKNINTNVSNNNNMMEYNHCYDSENDNDKCGDNAADSSNNYGATSSISDNSKNEEDNNCSSNKSDNDIDHAATETDKDVFSNYTINEVPDPVSTS